MGGGSSEQTERLREAFMDYQGVSPLSGLQEASPCLEKMCILRAKCAKFQALFWSKFTEMYDFLWSQGGTINAQFQSLFGQNWYGYDFGGCKG